MSSDKTKPPVSTSKGKRQVKTDRQVRQAAVGRASAEARRIAGVILRVLAGELGPAQASEALGRSPAQYYKLEGRALEGLLQGCEPRPRGRQPHPEQELSQLQAAHAKLQRECARLQSLVRLLGKTSSGNRKPPAARPKRTPGKTKPAKAKNGKRRRRKPTVRALRLAAQVTDNTDTTTAQAHPEPPASPARPGLPSPENPKRGGS